MNIIRICSIFIVLSCFCYSGNCAKILAVFPSPGYSQYILAEPLLVALAERGHNVTVISAFETRDVKNLRTILIGMMEDNNNIDPDALFALQEFDIFSNIVFLNQMCLNLTEGVLSNSEVQALIKSEETYDLVIVETFLNEGLHAFAKHFDAHQMLFSSIAVSEWNTHLIGVPNIPSYLPVTFAGYSTHMMMSSETIQDILTVIKGLKQKVLWKFENGRLKNMPKNLFTSKWFPQSDILAHPNTVAFISHCGMGSTTEAVYHGVPVIGIPIFGDQMMNVKKLVKHGMAIELPFKQISARTFNASIQKILYEETYREAAKRRSKILHDRPVKPLDEAIYWVEYVLRHEGAHHLKSSILALPWYQLYLVDVLLVLFAGLVLLVYMFYNLFCCLKRLIKRPKLKIL